MITLHIEARSIGELREKVSCALKEAGFDISVAPRPAPPQEKPPVFPSPTPANDPYPVTEQPPLPFHPPLAPLKPPAVEPHTGPGFGSESEPEPETPAEAAPAPKRRGRPAKVAIPEEPLPEPVETPAAEPAPTTLATLLAAPEPLDEPAMRKILDRYGERHPRRLAAVLDLLQQHGGARRLKECPVETWPAIAAVAQEWLEAQEEIQAEAALEPEPEPEAEPKPVPESEADMRLLLNTVAAYHPKKMTGVTALLTEFGGYKKLAQCPVESWPAIAAAARAYLKTQHIQA